MTQMIARPWSPVQVLVLVLVGALISALVLAVAVPAIVQAQSNGAIEFPENSKESVATFTADDPEGVTSITWSLAADAAIDGVEAADIVDGADHFTIDEDGVLKFSSPPDYENPSGEGAATNTYKVVVLAADAETGGQTGFHKVTVKVTKVDEPGTVALVTDTSDGTPQYLVGTELTATVTDGDITDPTQTFTADRAGEVTGVVWRWYRGETQITGADATDYTYTLVPDDAGEHIRAVVYYVVAGNVDQEMAEVTTDYPVLAARVGASQLKFDPAAVSRTISEGAKDRNVGAPVTATGNHGTIRYILADSGDATAGAVKFKIDEKTGQISTAVKLDFEADAAAAENCATKNSCTVTVIATDSTGTVTGATAPNLSATVTIKITNVNEAPTFSTGAQTLTVPENSTALFGAVADGYTGATDAAGVTYTAADPEGRTVSYSLAGPDASKFQISGDPPVLSFVSKPDFEAKASADRDNVYEVTVQASVGSDTGERKVRVTVSNVDEGPEISGPSTRNFAENGEGAVATFTATDPEGKTSIAWFVAPAADPDGTGPLTATDAADTEDFDIDAKTGALTFDVGGDSDSPDASVAPDFENPSGEGGTTSNTYKVVVGACDVALTAGACTDGNASYHKIVVTVTKVNEPGKVTLVTSTTDGTPQYLVGATLTATAEDGDITDPDQDFTVDRAGEVTAVTWQWYRGGTLIDAADAGDNTYTLVDADANNRITVRVSYRVGQNSNIERASRVTDYSVLAARPGANQLKFDPATVSRTISEGAKDRNVGAPVTATGNHGTIRYTLTGTDADQFEIDAKTGQIKTSVKLDYEGTAAAADQCDTLNDCTVTVGAKDSTGDDAAPSATVTIKITNVDETPTFSTGAEAIGVPENSTALWDASATGYTVTTVDGPTGVTYTAMDPEGLTVTYSLVGPDASKFQLSGSPPVLSFISKPDFEAKASADGDNVYEVTVRASVGSDTGERKVRVTVSNVDEAPVIMAALTTGVRISGDTRVSVAEGTTAVATYRASGPNADSARWSVTGTDAGSFSIGATTGVLTFRTAPDYETPGSADNDNIYSVTVTVRANGDTDTHNVTVTVTDVTEETPPPPADVVDQYDTDNSGRIDKNELTTAILDYEINQTLEKSGLVQLILSYEVG